MIWWVGACLEVLWGFDVLFTDGAEVGVVAINVMFLSVQRQPFMNHFDGECLLG